MAKDKELRIVETAILASTGLDQDEVAEAMSCHQGTVSKRLKEAKAKGYIEPLPPQLHEGTIDANLLEAARYNVSAGNLRDELRRRLNDLAGRELVYSVSIVRTSGKREHVSDWESRLRIIARFASQEIPALLRTATRVGVAWGYTLRFLVDELRAAKPLMRANFPTIFPVAGTFPHTGTTKPYPLSLTSTTIAYDLAEIVSGRVPDNQVNLSAVPAYLSRKLDPLRETLGEFYETLPDYGEVFGGPGSLGDREEFPEALMNSADMLITGLGDMPVDGSGSPTLRERLRQESASYEDWSKLIAGDISGVLLAWPTLKKVQRDKVAAINRRFIGIGLEDLKSISQRCVQTDSQRPGVVAIGHDRAKAHAVVEAVRNQCVNRLFIDYDLAVELQRILS